jgi:hypothetical protein
METLGFDEQDLHANRAGQLSSNQVRRRVPGDNYPLIFAIGGLLGIALTVIVLFAMWPNGLLTAAVFQTAAIVCVGISVLPRYRTSKRQPATDNVKSVTGTVECKYNGAADKDPFYTLIVGQRKFIMRKPLCDAFLPDAVYTFYYTDSYGIASAELTAF